LGEGARLPNFPNFYSSQFELLHTTVGFKPGACKQRQPGPKFERSAQDALKQAAQFVVVDEGVGGMKGVDLWCLLSKYVSRI